MIMNFMIIFFMQDEYSLMMYHIARLSGLLYAFDTHQISDSDLDELYYIYAEI